MVNKFIVEGFDAFIEKTEALKQSGKTTFVFFSGSKNEAGKSWCGDCVVAAPVVDAALDKFSSSDFNYLYVAVGGRNFWNDKSNAFRKDPRTNLKSIPTLLKFGTNQCLEEAQCSKKGMVEMLFEEE